MSVPPVSVLLCAHNDASYVRESVESILAQTYADFEFIILDDASTDRSGDLILAYAGRDSRIVPLRNETNLGLTKSLNRGLALARGEYIARQDADDISLPERLARQVEFLDRHPQVGVVGTHFWRMDRKGRNLHVMETPAGNREIREKLFTRGNAFAHGSVMFRKEAAREVGFFREAFRLAQDYDLWLRIAETWEMANIPEPLYRWRVSMGASSVGARHIQDAYAALARRLAAERRRDGKDSLQKGLGTDVAVVARAASGRRARRQVAENYRIWGLDFYRFRNYAQAFWFLLLSVLHNPWQLAVWRLAASAGRRAIFHR